MAWTSSTTVVDSLIRDYLVRRGFNNTLKTFDSDVKIDKEKGFRIERIVQQFLAYVNSYDLEALRSYWQHLDSTIFCRFEQSQMQTVKKVEYNLYRFYLVNCMQNGKKKECLESFDKLSQDLIGLPEWREWFMLPFTNHPETNKCFASYFSRQWTDTFLVSLHNFLAATFSCIPAPKLFEVIHNDQKKIKDLENEVKLLRGKPDDESISSTLKSKFGQPSYVKSMAIPGSLTEDEQTVTQPQKKKSLPFAFASKKNQVSSKTKLLQTKEASAMTPTTVSLSPKSSNKAINTSDNTRTKKLSGYQMQRQELLGGSASSVKGKTSLVKEDSSLTQSSSANQSPVRNKSLVDQPLPVDQSQTSVTDREVHINPSTVDKLPVSEQGALKYGSLFTQPENSTENKRLSMPVSFGNHSIIASQSSVTNTSSDNSHLLLSTEEYQEHHSAIVQCRFNTTGEMVASCDKDGVVKVWRYEPKLTTIASVMSRSLFLSLEWCKTTDSMLLLGTSNGLLRLYETSSKQVLQDVSTSNKYPRISHITANLRGGSFALSCVSLSALSEWSSSELETSATSGRLEIWNLKESQAEMSRILHESEDSHIKCMSYKLTESVLVCGNSQGVLTMFDTRTHKPVRSKQCHDSAIYSMQFSEGEETIYTLGGDGKFLAWDSREMSEPINLPIHEVAAGPFEVSGFGGYKQEHRPRGGNLFALEPGGCCVLTCEGTAGLVYSIDKRNSFLRREMSLSGHRSPVIGVDWMSASNYGRCLTASMDGRVRVTTLLKQ